MISPGTMLGGRYRLDERIAGGGMGDVWRCVDDVLGRTVAVKILLPSLAGGARFHRSASGSRRARWRRSTTPAWSTSTTTAPTPAAGAYLVMEYVEGDALSRTLSQVGRLTPARTMALVGAGRGRAARPRTRRGSCTATSSRATCSYDPNGTLVLTDFGIARRRRQPNSRRPGRCSALPPTSRPSRRWASRPRHCRTSTPSVSWPTSVWRGRPFEGDNPLEIAMRMSRFRRRCHPTFPRGAGDCGPCDGQGSRRRWPTAPSSRCLAGPADPRPRHARAGGPRPPGCPVWRSGRVGTGRPRRLPRPPRRVVRRSPSARARRRASHPGRSARPGRHARRGRWCRRGYPRGQAPGYLRAPVPAQPQQTSTALVVAIIVRGRSGWRSASARPSRSGRRGQQRQTRRVAAPSCRARWRWGDDGRDMRVQWWTTRREGRLRR